MRSGNELSQFPRVFLPTFSATIELYDIILKIYAKLNEQMQKLSCQMPKLVILMPLPLLKVIEI